MGDRRLVILDGYSLLFRAFFATRMLSTASGKPTNALYGFANMLFLILERERPDALFVALDAPGKTFRHAEFAEYKGTRKETAPELKEQLPEARRLLAALGVPCLEVVGYEADDVVGTVSKYAREHGYHTTIVTGDLDALQLVDDWVSVVTPSKGVVEVRTYTPKDVLERYGFGPEHIVDFKAIAGDTSDNIPGVPGIGEKGATDLIQRFGGTEAILENFAEVDAKYQKKIEPAKEQMLLSKRLATIDRAVPLHVEFVPFRLDSRQMQEALRMLEEFEFRSLQRRAPAVLGPYLASDGAQTAEPAPVQVVESFEAKLEAAKTAEALFAFVGSKPFSVVWAAESAQGDIFGESKAKGYVAVGEDVLSAQEDWVLALLSERLTQAALHDSKPTVRKLAVRGVPRFDAVLAAYVLQSGRSSYTLGDLAQAYLECPPPSDPQTQAVALGLLEKPMRERLEAEGQTRIWEEIEQPLVPVLADMETAGISLDVDMLREFSKSIEVQVQQLESKVHEAAGVQFNLGSPKQLGEVLFEKLGLPGKRTKNGWATGAEILQTLVEQSPIVSDIMAYRELTKLRSTYAEALPKLIHPDGRIRTTFNQTVAATGRLSSIEPNLQNIPVRTELGREIRRAFVAAPGKRLVSFDYSQIELRLLAHLCRDENLVRAFRDRIDVHSVTASLTFGVPVEEVTRDQRGQAKLLNYAVLYGVSDFGLAQQLGGVFSVAETRALIEAYFQRFPSVKAFTDGIVAEARSTGFTKTLWGRRRYFPDIHIPNRNLRMAVERQAVNAPIQGSAADMIKKAMIDVAPILRGTDTTMLLQVHDELLFEMPLGDDTLIEPIREAMEAAMPLDVPVEVDAKQGPNWMEMTKLPRA